MAVKLKDTADRCQFLEEENRVKAADLEKATMATKDTRSAMRAKKEELREAEILRLGSPLCYRGSSGIHGMPLWIGCGVQQTHIWTWRQALSMRSNTSKINRIVKWTSYSGRNSTFQSIRFP